MDDIKRYPLTWEFVAAVACFAGAALSVAIGFVVTTKWFLSIHPLARGAGVTLLIVALPILILGGHFLDLRDRKLGEDSDCDTTNVSKGDIN